MSFLMFKYFCSGLVPNEDAPDIIANTFLADITEEQLEAIHMAFLAHRKRTFTLS
jgi:hypothetical protein